MSHHGLDFENDNLNAASSFGDFAKLGATGKFPRGKIDRLDEGQICFAIAADHETKTIIINFGKPVVWIGMTADEALGIVNSLRDKALEIKTNSKH